MKTLQVILTAGILIVLILIYLKIPKLYTEKQIDDITQNMSTAEKRKKRVDLRKENPYIMTWVVNEVSVDVRD